jgi:hypothetical protein
LPELLAPQLGQHQLQALDFEPPNLGLALREHQCFSLREDPPQGLHACVDAEVERERLTAGHRHKSRMALPGGSRPVSSAAPSHRLAYRHPVGNESRNP